MTQAWRLSRKEMKRCFMVSVFFLIAITGCVPYRSGQNTFHNAYGQEILWETDTLPITVIIDPSLSLYYRNIVIGQIHNWNNHAGGELFSYSFGTRQNALDHTGSSCYLSTRFFNEDSSEDGTQILGRVIRHYNLERGDASTVIFCDIQIWNQLDPEIWDLVLMHELGHVIGLQHDDTLGSIMYRHVLNAFPVIERRDIEWAKYLLRRSGQ